MSSNSILAPSATTSEIMDESRGMILVADDFEEDYGRRYRDGSIFSEKHNFQQMRNSDFFKSGRGSQARGVTKMDPLCNFAQEFVSPASTISALNEHWLRGEHHSTPIDADAGIPLEAFSMEGWNVVGTDGEVQLPRQFLPQGQDWDYQFKEMDYGTDVIVISESENSADTGSMMAIDGERPSPTALAASSPAFRKEMMYPKSDGEAKIFSRSAHRRDREKKKKVSLVSSSKPSEIFKLRIDKHKMSNLTAKQLQVLSTQRMMNEQVKKQAPRFSVQTWDVTDPQANELMRRGTLHNLRLPSERRSYEINLEEKMQELKRVTRELGTMELRRHIVLTHREMAEFCYANHNKTRNLVLRGKEVFNVTGRRIQDFDLPYIFTFLVANPDVVYLDLSYNNVTNTGAWYIMDFLSWNNTLLGLNLMNNDINNLDSHMIDALCANKTLKSLRLNGNPLGKKGGEYIAFLMMFKELEHLDMGQTDQTVESVAWISQALMQTTTLKVLDLSRILGYRGYVGATLHLAITFSDILRFCVSLVELHVGKNGLTDVDLEQLLFGFSFNKRLELLDLACNNIGDHGAEMIADALHCGAPVKALVLNTNRIGDLGARALSLKLPMSQIKLLDVSANRITDQGIIDIVQTIRKPYPLLALFVFGNKINTQALEVVQALILSGDLNPESLDITVFYWEGAIGHGHKPAADRYRARYYNVPTNTKTETYGQKVSEHTPCRPGCLDYKFHNVVNVCGFPRHVTTHSLGPSCPV